MRKSPFTVFPLSERSRTYLLKSAENSSSKLLGVNWSDKYSKWVAKIQHQGGIIIIGLFEDKYQAAQARDNKALELYGENAVTNLRLGLLKEQEEMKQENTQPEDETPEHIFKIGIDFLRYLEKRKSRTGRFIEFSRAYKIHLNINDVRKVLAFLEEDGFIKIANKAASPTMVSVRFINKYIRENAERLKENISLKKQEEKQMAKPDITAKTPEELEAMAKELLALSQAKKQEIANGDHIKKTLNPLILNVCQAKGKYERLLDQQIDAMTEFNNAIDALKEALKS